MSPEGCTIVAELTSGHVIRPPGLHLIQLCDFHSGPNKLYASAAVENLILIQHVIRAVQVCDVCAV